MPARRPHPAHVYAECLPERLPRRMQELREALGKSRYALAQDSGISREMVGRMESGGRSTPTLCVLAQLSHGLGMSLREHVERLGEGVRAGCRAGARAGGGRGWGGLPPGGGGPARLFCV